MTTHRRGMLRAAFASFGAAFALAGTARADMAAVAPDKHKVVYHLADLDKVAFVLGNIQNHFDGMGGPDKVAIALVVHGPALKAFHAASANADVTQRVDKFAKAGVAFDACGKTMQAQEVTLKDLLPGFVVAEQGGVVRLAELQSQGYVYLRP
jgi:intracellular sulfur oxidation DsrE/DsrF family protein